MFQFSPAANRDAAPVSSFLWWLSTAEKELIADAVTDRNRYRIIGMTVLATWLFATLAWTYFFFTVTGQLLTAIPTGLFMGWIILTIDRALIKGIQRSNRKRILPLLFRFLLALAIGTFMAQPALLYLFRKEIRLQVVADNEQKAMKNDHLLDSIYQQRTSTLLQQQTGIEQQLQAQYERVSAARNNYLAEADGSGGTGKVGISTIAKAKEKAYEQLKEEYGQLQQRLQPALDSLKRNLGTIAASRQSDQQQFREQFNEGFLTQIEALYHLLDQHPALQFRYYLLVVVLLLIELMPVLAKSMLPAGTYEERVALLEQFETEQSRAGIQSEKERMALYHELAAASDKEAMTAFFDKRRKQLGKELSGWPDQSMQADWLQLKQEQLTDTRY